MRQRKLHHPLMRLANHPFKLFIRKSHRPTPLGAHPLNNKFLIKSIYYIHTPHLPTLKTNAESPTSIHFRSEFLIEKDADTRPAFTGSGCLRRRWRREPKQRQSSDTGSCNTRKRDANAHYSDQLARADPQQYGHPTPHKQHADECAKRHGNTPAYADANRHAHAGRQFLQRV